MEPHAAAWGRDSRGSRSRRFSARPSLAHARKSIAGPQLRSSLLPPDRQEFRAYASSDNNYRDGDGHGVQNYCLPAQAGVPQIFLIPLTTTSQLTFKPAP